MNSVGVGTSVPIHVCPVCIHHVHIPMHSPCFSEIPWLLAKLLYPFVGDISIHPFCEVIIVSIVHLIKMCVISNTLAAHYIHSTFCLSVTFVSQPKYNYPNALFGQLFCPWAFYSAADCELQDTLISSSFRHNQ